MPLSRQAVSGGDAGQIRSQQVRPKEQHFWRGQQLAMDAQLLIGAANGVVGLMADFRGPTCHPFHTLAHQFHLVLDICSGLRGFAAPGTSLWYATEALIVTRRQGLIYYGIPYMLAGGIELAGPLPS